MNNASLVFLTADTDCDGTLVAAHRVAVPAHRVREFIADHDAFVAFSRESDAPMMRYASDAYDLMPLRDFLSQYGHVFSDADDRAQFCGADYYWHTDEGIRREPGHPYARVWDNLRDCTAPYETTADLNEAHWLDSIEADMEFGSARF